MISDKKLKFFGSMTQKKVIHLDFFYALIRKVQVVIEQPTVGAAFNRDYLISRLKAAPSTNTTCFFQITTFFYSTNCGVLECWSNGYRIDVLFFNTPILHHSRTPGPKLSKTFGNLIIIFLIVIVPKKYN